MPIKAKSPVPVVELDCKTISWLDTYFKTLFTSTGSWTDHVYCLRDMTTNYDELKTTFDESMLFHNRDDII